MSKIETKICIEKDLTVHRVSGPLSNQDVSIELDRYYSAENITKLKLWDLTREKQPLWQLDDVTSLVNIIRGYAHLRAGGKTALVVSEDVDFGISRMLQAHAENTNFALLKIF